MKIIVEADDGRNSTIDWQPAKIKLRGRFSRMNFVPPTMGVNGVREMPDIPGQHIEIDTELKLARVYDPLTEAGNKELLNRINKASKRMDGHVFAALPEKRYSLKDNIEMNTWIYWIRQFVNLGYFKVRQGDIPHVAASVKCNFNDFTEKAVKQRKVDTKEEETLFLTKAEEERQLALAN